MALQQSLQHIEINTNGEGFTNITAKLNDWVASSGMIEGLINLTLLHTSASLTINENADPRVLKDLSAFLKALVPEEGFKPISGHGAVRPYCHAEEGPDDMPAHIRTALTCTTMSLSIQAERIVLGTWQAIYLWEHRSVPHLRKIAIHAIGEMKGNQKHQFKTETSTILAKGNGQKLNEMVQDRHNPKAWAEDGGVATDIDLMVDRLHELSGGENNQ